MKYDFDRIIERKGQGFMRLNVAVPRSVIREAMERLHEAVKNFD